MLADRNNFLRFARTASAPGENFDTAPAPAAPAPTQLYSRAKFLKGTKV
jgi:hypothetical protein